MPQPHDSNWNVSVYHKAKGSSQHDKVAALAELLDGVRDGKWAAPVALIRAEADKKARRALKSAQLLGFIPTGVQEGQRLTDNPFTTRTGLIALDLDLYHATDSTRTASEVRDLLAGEPHCAAAYISTSGEGVKAFMHVTPTPQTPEEHRRAWDAVHKWLRDTHNLGFGENAKKSDLDSAGRNIVQLQFISHDPQTHYNANATMLEWQKWEPEEHERRGGRGRQPNGGTGTPTGAVWTEAEVARMLDHCDPDGSRNDYRLPIARSLHAWANGSEAGRRLWMDFARKATRSPYPDDEYERWYDDAPPGRFTIGTLVHYAKEGGWKPAARPRPAPPSLDKIKAREGAREKAARDEGRPFLQMDAPKGWDHPDNLARVVLEQIAREIAIVKVRGEGSLSYVIYRCNEQHIWEPSPVTLHADIARFCEVAILDAFSASPTNDVAKALVGLLRYVHTPAGKKAVVEAMPPTAYNLSSPVRWAEEDDLNKSGYVGMKNGVWSLWTLKKCDAIEAQDALITRQWDVTYDPQAPYHEAVGKMLECYGKGQKLILRHLGRAAWRDPGEHFVVIEGKKNSSKSTLIKAITGLDAKPMMVDALKVSPNKQTHNDSLSPVFRASFCTIEEAGEATLGNVMAASSILKRLTSGVGARETDSPKGKPQTDRKVTGTFFMTANGMPGLGLQDPAMEKRLRLFHVAQHAVNDPSVVEELVKPDGPARRYLVWLILENAQITPPGTAVTDDDQERPDWMMKAMNRAGADELSEFDVWLKETMVRDDTKDDDRLLPRRVLRSELRDAWCKHNNAIYDASKDKVGGVVLTTIPRRAQRLGFEEHDKKLRPMSGDGGVEKGWLNYRLRDPSESGADEAAEEQAKQEEDPDMPPCSAQWVDEKNDQGAYKRCPQHDVTWWPQKNPQGRPTCWEERASA